MATTQGLLLRDGMAGFGSFMFRDDTQLRRGEKAHCFATVFTEATLGRPSSIQFRRL
jgi:hypothetical protein